MNKKILLLGASILLFPACAKAPYLSSAKSSQAAFEECRRFSEKKDFEKASECFELLKSRFAGSSESAEADLEIADNYFRKKDFLLAAESYAAFIKLHPAHERVGYAYYKAGLSYFREAPKAVDRDQQKLKDSIPYLETAVESAGGDLNAVAQEKLKDVRRRLAQREFYVGRYYYRTGEFISAIPRFQEILANYTGLGLDEKTLYLLGDSYRKLALKEKGLEILSVFDQHFPQSDYRKKLAGKLGVK